MRFDLLIRGGEVVDPGGGKEGRLDVAIERDRIAAVDKDISPESAFHVVDAGGQIVTPGLVDLHTHVFHKITYWGIDPDPVASRTGVTTWNDAGSAGALTLPGLRDFVVRPAQVGITAFLNISSIGLVCDDYECANSHYLDVELFRRLADRNRDLVRGVKVRMGNVPTFEGDALEPLRRARRAADECELPLMVHIAFGPPAVEEVLPFLKPNDVLTHCFTGLPMRIVDAEGRLLDTAKRAWDSGVVMDIGHGTGSFSFETAEAVTAAGHKPDVISTDLHQLSINGPAFDLPTTLSKFIHLGMSLREVGRGSHFASRGRARPRERGRDAAAGVACRRRALQDLPRRLPAAGHRRQRASRRSAAAEHHDDRRRQGARAAPGGPRSALDGGADLAAVPTSVHREAAAAARARTDPGRDGGCGRRNGVERACWRHPPSCSPPTWPGRASTRCSTTSSGEAAWAA